MERALLIYKLTPGVKASGSRTAAKLLPRNTTARRARYAVAEFPNDPRIFGGSRCAPRRGTFPW